MHLRADNANQQEAEVSKLAEMLPLPTNTNIPLRLIRRHPKDWQAHLLCISDFLFEVEGIWWKREEGNIVFNEITNHPSVENHSPQLHHFRSSTLPKEEAYLQQCWQKYLNKKIPIPAEIVPVNEKDGKVKVLQTTQASVVESENNQDNSSGLLKHPLEEMQPADEEKISITENPLQTADEEIISITENPCNQQMRK